MNIVFITVVSYPFGGATSSRTRNLVKLFTSCGHFVHVISYTESKEKTEIINSTYESIDNNGEPIRPEMVLDTLKKYNSAHEIDVVCMNAKSNIYWLMLDYCKEKNIKLIIESCEWYDSSNFRYGEKDSEYIQNQKMIQNGFAYADGFISISRLLNDHNNQVGKNSVRIPTILDASETEYSTKVDDDNIIKLVYTGRPGKSKELLKPIIVALVEDRILKKNFCLDLYGINTIQFLRNINYNVYLFLKARKIIRIHGAVEQSIVDDVIRNSDFQVFIRPYRRSSNAGFPTKLGESMMVGTPVVANDTGDICMYLCDRENGMVVRGLDSTAVAEVLHNILEIPLSERKKMRENARKTAEQYFDFRNYKEQMNMLLDNL